MLLAIDSAAGTCSAAIWDVADGLRAQRALEPARGQAERLIELVEAVLADASVGYDDLGSLAVAHGPGSFTGLRSAVATARGLALATGLGVIPVSTLEALACGAPGGEGMVLAALDARRGEVYAQGFGADLKPLAGPLGAPRAVAPQEVAKALVAHHRSAPVRLAGNGAHLVRACLPAEVPTVIDEMQVDATMVARCAARRLAAGERPVAGFVVRPLYLRAPDARPPRPFLARDDGPAAVQMQAS